MIVVLTVDYMRFKRDFDIFDILINDSVCLARVEGGSSFRHSVSFEIWVELLERFKISFSGHHGQ